MEIGAQFYTIREFCKTPEGLAESLKKVADIGYRTVQLSAICECDPNWLAEQLRANDLRCVLTHTPANKLLADPAAVAAEHDLWDCHYVGLGMATLRYESLEEDLEDFFAKYAPVAKALREHGKYFMYHNHAQEFRKLNGRTVMEIMAERIPAEDMGFTLDTYWIQAGGADPAQIISCLAGRVPCIHLKDFAFADDKRMAVVGEGNINFDRVFQEAEKAGTKYMLVEQDHCYGEDPFDCLKRSYENLRAYGFR